MSKWEPIETAPKNEVILLGRFIPSLIGFVRIWVHEGYFEGSWRYEWNVHNWNVEPTHWMPLPESPTEKDSI